MQTDTRIAFEGLVLGLYRVGVLPRDGVRAVLHTMENHAQSSKSLTSAIDIEQLLRTVMQQLPAESAERYDDGIGEDGMILGN